MTSLPQEIMEFVSRDGYEPLKAKALAKKLGIKKKRAEEFEQVLQDLLANHRLQATETGKIKLPSQRVGLHGILRKVASGNGYVVLHEPKPADLTQDIFVEARDLGDAQSGDEVAVQLVSRVKSGGSVAGGLSMWCSVPRTASWGSTSRKRDKATSLSTARITKKPSGWAIPVRKVPVRTIRL